MSIIIHRIWLNWVGVYADGKHGHPAGKCTKIPCGRELYKLCYTLDLYITRVNINEGDLSHPPKATTALPTVGPFFTKNSSRIIKIIITVVAMMCASYLSWTNDSLELRQWSVGRCTLLLFTKLLFQNHFQIDSILYPLKS